MIPFTSPMHSVSVVPLTLRQSSEIHKDSPSDLALFGWGFILILTILGGRHLMIFLHQKYRSRRSLVLLQRQAKLERLLTYKLPHKHVSKKNKFQRR